MRLLSDMDELATSGRETLTRNRVYIKAYTILTLPLMIFFDASSSELVTIHATI